MPITFKVAAHGAEPIKNYAANASCDREDVHGAFLRGAASIGFQEFIQTSVQDFELPDLIPKRNGFVFACIDVCSYCFVFLIRHLIAWL